MLKPDIIAQQQYRKDYLTLVTRKEPAWARIPTVSERHALQSRRYELMRMGRRSRLGA